MSAVRYAAVLLVAVAQPVITQEASRGHPLQQAKLENGLQVLVMENHAAPLATVLVAVRSGAAVQRRTERGLAHLFEHLLFRSYGNGPSAFGGDAGSLNASYNGATSAEFVTFSLLLPSENTVEGIRLLGILLTRPRFRPADLERERVVVLDELERAQSDPEQALAREVSRQLWGAAWHRRDVLGDSVSLSAITPTQVIEEYARYYVPNNAALIVTGDVIHGEVVDAATRYFGEWAAGDDPFAERPFVPFTALTGSRGVIVARDQPDVTIHIEMQGPGLRDDLAATYAADALFGILNDPSSHFQRQLVGQGFFQSVGAYYRTLSERGPITIAGSTTAAQAHDALWSLIAQLDSIGLLVGVREEDLLIATKRREVEATVAREATAMLAQNLAFWWAVNGIDYYLTYGECMNALALEDLRRFAERYLVGQPMVMGLMGPNDAMARIAEWLGAARGANP